MGRKKRKKLDCSFSPVEKQHKRVWKNKTRDATGRRDWKQKQKEENSVEMIAVQSHWRRQNKRQTEVRRLFLELVVFLGVGGGGRFLFEVESSICIYLRKPVNVQPTQRLSRLACWWVRPMRENLVTSCNFTRNQSQDWKSRKRPRID